MDFTKELQKEFEKLMDSHDMRKMMVHLDPSKDNPLLKLFKNIHKRLVMMEQPNAPSVKPTPIPERRKPSNENF